MSESVKKDCFKEAVCVEAMRVFDSCSSQDCLEDLVVEFSKDNQRIIDGAASVKSRCVEVMDVNFAIDPVPFNKGFYSVDLTYTFKVDFEVLSCNGETTNQVSGIARFSKKVILFGSEGNTKQFTSEDASVPALKGCCSGASVPKAAVSVVDPIILDTKLICNPCHPPKPICDIECKCGKEEECESKPMSPVPANMKMVKITIGLFSIVRLERPVSVLVPVYDYCVPLKECSNTSDSPCELFEKIAFPTDEFFPKGLDDDLIVDSSEEETK